VPLLSVITNGRRLRIYAPFWNRAKSFAETLLWEFDRRQLADSRHIEALAAVLSHEALASKKAISAVQQREATVEFIWEFAEEIRQRRREWGQQLGERIRQIDQQIAALDAEQRRREKQLRELGPKERDNIRRLFRLADVPLVPTGQFGELVAAGPEPGATHAEGAAPGKRRKPTPREWTADDLRAKATPYQRRIFAAFVRLGRRTLGLKEIARRVRLSPRTVAGAMVRFRVRKEIGGREPLILFQKTSANEHRRRGHLYSIAPRYWPVLRRLYRDKPRRRREKR